MLEQNQGVSRAMFLLKALGEMHTFAFCSCVRATHSPCLVDPFSIFRVNDHGYCSHMHPPDLPDRFLLLPDSLILSPSSICKRLVDYIGLPHNPG